MEKVRLTMAQAVIQYLSSRYIDIDGKCVPLFAGVFAIFGHGNVSGIGEALYHARDVLPTFRAHNEQGMSHIAIAFAKANRRQRMMACTSSIGPGATNMITSAALAHVNRLPVLFLPGDIFANRVPDPVLQQLECFSDATVSVNDCFRPVSRYFDRIMRPEQIMNSLPVAMQTLLSPENCGPVTLALPQDVQTEAFDYPVSFFAKRIYSIRQPMPEKKELDSVVSVLSRAKKPLVIAGGGVHYSNACDPLRAFVEKYHLPLVETQSGKGTVAWDHPNYMGAIGVTGCDPANDLAKRADVVLAIGTRLQDFTTASKTIFKNPDVQLIQLNVAAFDAIKHQAQPLVCDAKSGLRELEKHLVFQYPCQDWLKSGQEKMGVWNRYYDLVTSKDGAPKTQTGLPSDAEVLGAVKRTGKACDVIVCAAGGLPGELHKLWRTERQGGYHLEYGYSCMGYEIAGGVGVKMAMPGREVIVVVGDGSYMMLNSELSTGIMLERKIIVVVLDNRGFACINRLQKATGGEPFNNLLADCLGGGTTPAIDFAQHAASLGAESERVSTIDELERALHRARKAVTSYVICLQTDPFMTSDGGSWWNVPVAEVSVGERTGKAYREYQTTKKSLYT